MGKLSDLNIPTREGYIGHPERITSDLKSIYRKIEPMRRLATEGVGQVLFGDEGTIPWYMSMAPGADLTDKLMEGKQPGLLDIPGPGTLAKIAMLPIAKFGSKEIVKGTARMGKNARNLDNAKNPVIERWHRTRSKNDDSIRDKGLLVGKDNPNYGRNTGDESGLKIPAVWLGTSPTEIPVLQYYAKNKPDDLSTYRIRIPKDEYYSTPRLKWDSGNRGNTADARIVANGESSLTGETGRRTGRESLIDLYGKSIPPEYLEKISPSELKALVTKDNEREVLNELFHKTYGRDATPQELYEFGTKLPAKLSHIERQKTPVGNLEDAVSSLADEMEWTKYNKYPVSPKRAFVNGLNNAGVKLGDELPYGSTFLDRFNADNLDEMSNYISEGHISRGNRFKMFPTIRDRMYNWKKYRDGIEQGLSPAEAHAEAMPDVVADVSSGKKYRSTDRPFLRSFGAVVESPQRGAISRAIDVPNVSVAKLRTIADKNPRARSDLKSVIKMSSNPSALIEAIATAKDGTLAEMKGLLSGIAFDTQLGRIGRVADIGGHNVMSPYAYFKTISGGDKQKLHELMRENIRQNVGEANLFAFPRSLKSYME